MRSRLHLLHERLTRALQLAPDQRPTFTSREGIEAAAHAVERALARYDEGDVAGAARELHGVDQVSVDSWEWDPIGHAYLDCRYALDNGRVEQDPKVIQRLSELYGAEVEWRGNGKYHRDDIILDGRNIGDHCVVEGEWFGLDDLRIECDDPAYQPVRVK